MEIFIVFVDNEAGTQHEVHDVFLKESDALEAAQTLNDLQDDDIIATVETHEAH